jgi:hypothetical protein
MNQIILQFSTSFAWQSGVIRFLCHSPFSHVDLILPDPVPHGCLGASDPGGVTVRAHDYQPFKTRRRATIKTDKAYEIVKLVQSQIGKPFDPKAMKAVLSDEPREWREPDAWFCSELIAWALEKSGFFSHLIVPKNRITPSDLVLLLNVWIDPEEFGREFMA